MSESLSGSEPQELSIVNYACREIDGTLTTTVERLRVFDHGTGVGEVIVRALDHSEMSAAFDDRDIHHQTVVTIHLRPTEHPPWIEVTGPGEDQVTHCKYEPADHVLSLLTRHRLDTATEAGWLHAAAVEIDGSAVVMLGGTGAGKSTLVAHLAEQGATLLTDEQLCVHPDKGVVTSTTRPVAIKPGGTSVLPPRLRPDAPDENRHTLLSSVDYGWTNGVVARPALIIELARDSEPLESGGSDESSGEGGIDARAATVNSPLDPARALTVLCANNLDLSRSPHRALSALTWLAATVPAVRLGYSDSASAAMEIGRLLSSLPDHSAVSWRVDSPGRDDPSERSTPGAYCRSEGVATAWLGDEAVLFAPASRNLVRLNDSGSHTWASLPLFDSDLDDESRQFLEELHSHALVQRVTATHE